MSSQNTLVSSLIVIVALVLSLGVGAWMIMGSPGAVPRSGLELAPPTSDEPVYITVQAGDTAASIGKRLQAAGVIDSASGFQRLAAITGTERTLAAGEYEFVRATSTLDALTRIRDGLTAARIVGFPEGMRLEEVADLLDKRGVVKADAFLAAANTIATNGTGVDADLLSSRPRTATLEGYIYPATYSFSRTITPDQVVLTMLDAMSERFTPQLRADARAQGLTVHQVLTLAAIVEREVVVPEERPIIASVYRNRLDDGMPLQADPTVQYAITARPGSVAQYGYWKKELSLTDLQFPSAYNTYVEAGLPPGPIGSVSIEAIEAVIRPAQTNYLYFVAQGNGKHAFSATFDEHQMNVQRYQP
jgi:UPF0755 protein